MQSILPAAIFILTPVAAQAYPIIERQLIPVDPVNLTPTHTRTYTYAPTHPEPLAMLIRLQSV